MNKLNLNITKEISSKIVFPVYWKYLHWNASIGKYAHGHLISGPASFFVVEKTVYNGGWVVYTSQAISEYVISVGSRSSNKRCVAGCLTMNEALGMAGALRLI